MYRKRQRIRFSETDEQGLLTMSGLLRIFQDLIFLYVEQRRLGRKYTKKTGCTWFRLSWQVDVIKMPKVTERVRLETYITEVRQSLVYMEIVMKNRRGEILAIAEDMLCYVDINNARPMPQDESIWPRMDFGEPSGHEFKGRKIIIPPDAVIKTKKDFKISVHFLDINKHANNVRLIGKAMEISGLIDCDVKSLRAEFKRQILPGSKITATVTEGDGTVKVQFKNEAGQVCDVFEFSVLDYVDLL